MTDNDDTLRASERAILGSFLLAPNEAVRPALEVLTSADFSDARLGDLYDVVATMYGEGTPIELISVVAEAARSAGPARHMHAAEIFDLQAETFTASNVGWHINQVAEGAGKRRMKAHGTRLAQLAEGDMDLGELMKLARGEWESITHHTASELEAVTLGELLIGQDDYDWLIPDLLERLDRLILTGGEGSGKSTLARQIAILAAAGIHPTTFKAIKPIRVLVVDAENSARQWRRKARPLAAKAAQVGARDPRQHMHVVAMDQMEKTQGRLDLTKERDLGAVHRLIDRHEPDLLLIGPLYKLVPGAINSDDDAAPLLTALDSLRARGVAMVMEAHAGHGTGSSGDREWRPRGSAALMGWPEFGMGLAMDRSALMPGQPPTVFNLLRWRGDRDERAWPHTLVRGGVWPWTDDSSSHAQGLGPTWTPSHHAAVAS